jgi:hypothetical protein
MAELVTVVWVRRSMVVKVSQRAVHPILKPTDPNVVAQPRTRRDSRVRSVSRSRSNTRAAPIRPASGHLLILSGQMGHSSLIPAPESIPVRLSLLRRKMRIAVFIAVVRVKLAVIVKVLLSADDPVSKPLALDILQLGWRRIPPAAFLPIPL